VYLIFLYFGDRKDIMSGTIIRLKRHRLLPAISFLSVILLLTGEFFSCCRINEILSNEVHGLILKLGLIRQAHPIASASEEEDHHAHCHGHANHSPQQIEIKVIPGASGYTQDGSCISELSLTKKSMVESVSPTWVLSTASFGICEETAPLKFVSVNRPRPQNRSSPPVYLLTRRLLV
jgi:hypothetical protein